MVFIVYISNYGHLSVTVPLISETVPLISATVPLISVTVPLISVTVPLISVTVPCISGTDFAWTVLTQMAPHRFQPIFDLLYFSFYASLIQYVPQKINVVSPQWDSFLQ